MLPAQQEPLQPQQACTSPEHCQVAEQNQAAEATVRQAQATQIPTRRCPARQTQMTPPTATEILRRETKALLMEIMTEENRTLLPLI